MGFKMAKTDTMTQINSTTEYAPTYGGNTVGISGTNTGLKIKADYTNYKLTATPIKMSKFDSGKYITSLSLGFGLTVPLEVFAAILICSLVSNIFLALLLLSVTILAYIKLSFMIADMITPLHRKGLIKSLPEEFTSERLKKNAELFSEASTLPEATFELKIIEDASEILRQYEELVTKQKSNSQNLSNRVATEKTDLFENVFKNEDSENSKD